MADSVKVMIEAILKDDKFKKGVKGIRDDAKKTTGMLSNMKGMLAGLGVAFSAVAIIRGFKQMISSSMELEQAVANVASVVGDKGATGALKALAIEASTRMPFSAKQSADALYFLASAGLSVTDMTKTLGPSLTLAAAAGLDVAKATDILVGQLKTFRKPMDDAAKFTDIMAKTVASANTDMNQLGDALSYAGAVAAQNGIPFEDLNAVLATMADQGIKGGRAGTQLRMALTRLIKPTGEAAAVLEKYGITQAEVNEALKDPIELFKLLQPVTENAADAVTLFGVRQQNVIGIIKNGIPRLEELRQKIGEAGGAAKKMADIQIDTLSSKMKILGNILSNRADQLVSSATPAMKGLADAAIDLLKPEESLVGVTKELVKTSGEYANITKTLADESANLTKQERTKLKIRQAELKLNIAENITKMSASYKKYQKEVFLLTAALKRNKIAIDSGEKGLEKFRDENGELQKSVFVTGGGLRSLDKFLQGYNNSLKDGARWEKRLAELNYEHDEAVRTLAIGLKNNLVTKGQLIGVDKELIEKAIKLSEVINEQGEVIKTTNDNSLASYSQYGEAVKEILDGIFEKKMTDDEKLKELDGILKEQFKMSEEELLTHQIEMLNEAKDALLEHADERAQIQEAITKLEEKQNDIRKEKALKTYNDILGGIKGVFSNVQSIMGSWVNLERKKYDDIDKEDTMARAKQKTRVIKAFKAQKAADYATNVIQTSLAAMKAYQAMAGIPYVGPALGIIAAGAAIAAGALRGKEIRSQEIPEFQAGTESVPSTGNALVHAGERIIPAGMNVSGVSNEDLMASAISGLGVGPAGAGNNVTNNNNVTNESIDNRSPTYNFYGVRDISSARNELLKTEGQGAF